MQYQYATEKINYEDYAAGRVLYSQVGMTAFPVRLASELLQRCVAIIKQPQLRLYDPCGGSGYLLTILGFLHGEHITALWLGDVQPEAVQLARKNLSLLTTYGLNQRQSELEALLHQYGKPSHADALASVELLRQQLPRAKLHLQTWVADALKPPLAPHSVDVLITDVPYGAKVAWGGIVDEDPIWQLLDVHYRVLAHPSVVAIISDKKQKAAHPYYRQLLHDKIGKRRITLLQPVT